MTYITILLYDVILSLFYFIYHVCIYVYIFTQADTIESNGSETIASTRPPSLRCSYDLNTCQMQPFPQTTEPLH